ncbi:MAG: SufD family Fe-S cluster assembly protein, partial [Variovorax sp.]
MPSLRDEAWRFTDLSPMTQRSFRPLETPSGLTTGDVEHFYIGEAATRLVFVDGVHAPHLSSTDAAGVVAGDLAAMISSHRAAIEAHLARHAGFHDNLFVALNTAFLHDAAAIIVPRQMNVAAPVHLLFIATQPDVASHPRVLVVAEPDSSVVLIEEYVALQDGAYFTNAVAEVAVGANACVEHVRVQRESGEAFHIGHCAVSLAH